MTDATSRVLIIESDPILLTGLAALLHQEGHECLCAQDLEAAEKAVRQDELQLIIAEAHVDEGDTLTYLAQLRKTNSSHAPLLITTELNDEWILERIRQLPDAYFLRKPYDPNLLLEVVDKLIWMPRPQQAQSEAAWSTSNRRLDQAGPAAKATRDATRSTSRRTT